ncbi:exodeoxyribonuclease VII small subunit [bacterium]|nr:MAG: exodeoxyribonuclease VII small subunit [bacterium]
MAKKKEDKDSFEYAYNRLEVILSNLENDAEQNSLEDILKYYQEGLQLLKTCRIKLSEAELKIEKINAEKMSS